MYLIYRIDNGEILSAVSGSPEHVREQVGEGEGLIEGVGTWLDSKIVDGALVRLSKPRSLPFEGAIWDFALAAWVDQRTLDDIKAQKWSEIKQKRDEIEFAPFSYRGWVFDGDATAQRRLAPIIDISRAKIANNEPFYYPWKTADGTLVTLQAEDFINMQLAKVQQFGNAFFHAEELRKQIDLAQTKQEVEAVQW